MKMLGEFVEDKKKNTATSKHVNDRLRRRAKRIERAQLQADLGRREYFSVQLLGR